MMSKRPHVAILAYDQLCMFEFGIAVEAGRFRADLYYRLNVFPVQVPPLRDRLEDLPLLVEHFLSKFHLQYHKRTLGLSDKALELCLHYAWPGNIRELENVVERGVILTDSNETIGQDALFAVFPKAGTVRGDRLNADGALVQAEDTASTADWVTQIFERNISLEAVEEQLMRRAMDHAQQNVAQAARILGLTRPALAYRLKKSDILDEDATE